MSRIAGLVNFNGQPVESAVLSDMLNRQSPRGATGQAIWRDNAVGFAYQSSADTPPLTVGSLIITADARLDNRGDLLAQCGLNQASTPEIIAAAYRKWGIDCPQHLLGDFSFAIWDSAAEMLVCATDPFGIHPLYYAHTADGLAFASDIDALLAVPDIDHALNERALVTYLAMLSPAPGDTFYRQIQRLPARHSLQVTQADLKLRPYWTLDPTREIHFKSDAEYEAAFLDLLREAVRCRLEGAESVGAMLSGGLDSSAVVGIASDLLQQAGRPPLHSFYLASPSPSCDESPYVQAVAAQAHTCHHDLPYLSPLSDLDEVVDPTRNLSSMLYYAASLNLFRAAGAAGVSVILTGTDGDNTVGHGRAYLAELAAAQQWDALEAELTGLCQHFGGTPTPYLRHYAVPILRDWAQSGQWGKFARGVNMLTQRWQFSRRRLIWREAIRPRLPELVADGMAASTRSATDGHLTAGFTPARGAALVERRSAGTGSADRASGTNRRAAGRNTAC